MGTATQRRTMRVTETTHRILRELAGQSGDSMTVIVERAVERYQREQLLTGANEAWAVLQADPSARADIEAEQALWEQTLGDGLEREEW